MTILKFVSQVVFWAGFSRWLTTLFRQPKADDLYEKVALVTGGSRGLGLLITRELAHSGCRMAICARDETELEEAKVFLARWGVHDVLAVPCDVSNHEDVEDLIETVQMQIGPIDLLVNNAGVIQAGPIQSQTVDDFRQSLDVMFWGSLYPTMTLLPRMLARSQGHIVNVTSVGGKVAVPHLLPYGAAKFAATGFSEGLAAETAGTGVHVTTVVPGLMRTGSYLNAYFKGDHKPEFKWFGLSDNLPFLSMDAEVAARQIVRAIKRRKTEVVLTFPAKVLVRLHGLFPVFTIKLLGVMNRLLLPEGENPTKKRGMTIQDQIDSFVFNTLTTWGRAAARRFNQYERGRTNVDRSR